MRRRNERDRICLTACRRAQSGALDFHTCPRHVVAEPQRLEHFGAQVAAREAVVLERRRREKPER